MITVKIEGLKLMTTAFREARDSFTAAIQKAIQAHAERELMGRDMEISMGLSKLAYHGYPGADRLLHYFWTHRT